MVARMRRPWLIATVATVSVIAVACGSDDGDAGLPAADGWQRDAATSYHRLATYPVFRNLPGDLAPDTKTVAEISAVTEDGKTLIYTDAPGKRIGFLDLSDPAAPAGAGTISLEQLGHADDQPTSVAVAGDYVLVVIDSSGGDFAHPSGRVDVVRISDRTKVHSIDLGGQPDSIAVSKDGTRAAIAMENQRDEKFTPEGGEEGDLPQRPTGFVQLLDLSGEPNRWSARPVHIDENAARQAGLDTPQDLEPEYVSINSRGEVAVTLQENNGIAIIDAASATVRTVFSAGKVSVDGIDTAEDGTIDQSGSITDVAREPDAVGWIGEGHIAVANEGDWKGGSRGWTVYDAATGAVVWDAGNSFEQLTVRTGLHTEGRAEKKGPEPEGLAVTELDGKPVVLVGSERGNFVAVYDVADPAAPEFRQILATNVGPEGILPIPSRNLLAVSSEEDDAEKGLRGAVTVFGYGSEFAGKSTARFPSVVSADGANGAPIGWGALGALSADPAAADRLYTATDSAYGPARILGLDVSTEPAVIESELAITEHGAPVNLDIEGLAARTDGGFYLAVEGEEGPGNSLVQVAKDGVVERRIALPGEISAGLGKYGLEGVAVQGSGAEETVWVVLQRELKSDPKGVTRIGKYAPASGEWQWYGYQLETTSTEGDWIGVSEIAVDGDSLLLLERDKLSGPAAAVKGVYRVAIPGEPGVAGTAVPAVVPKTRVHDLLPELSATNGWVQEKVEGMAIAGNGGLHVVTDNDGVDDATGETVLIRVEHS
ncbi:esterase-like activity of phytase family protein [Nocardia cyriacigeorgica]|uniref:esterase-like activity of phytase family protein n=1 Tax=Nocardia cyriacigeorgica TaxID=135487 RepID=UPI0002EADA2B|nr:alkaline phosphatase [Nocardia cyriacigeorgica]MBF6321430.1 esterase-like activity of phytase family protein [Nocardia cyriacigeorgica]TLF57269.1 esterase-like activity of phytase family protein [Nocardia cyriacigeorgica]